MKSGHVMAALLYGVLALSCGGCGDDTTGDAGAAGGTGDSGGSGGDGGSGASGGSSGAGGGEPVSCPTLATLWLIEEHCTAGFVSETIPITQTECTLVVGGAFSGLEGTVGDDGEIALSGSLGVMPYACEGTAGTSEMTLTCTEECPVRLTAQ